MVLEDRQQAIGLVSADHQAAVRELLGSVVSAQLPTYGE
jgi:hypothetical protein